MRPPERPCAVIVCTLELSLKPELHKPLLQECLCIYGKQIRLERRQLLGELQEALAEAVLRLNEAAEKETETAAALEEADKKLRALKSERERMKDLEGREAQHVQVCKPQCVQRCKAESAHACSRAPCTAAALPVHACKPASRPVAYIMPWKEAACCRACQLQQSMPARGVRGGSWVPRLQTSSPAHMAKPCTACKGHQCGSPCHAG